MTVKVISHYEMWPFLFMDIITLLILIGATYRLTSLFLAQSDAEPGPYGILNEFRHFVGVRYNEHSNAYGLNEFAQMLTCVYCLSFWVGVAVAVAYVAIPDYTTIICLPLALSTGVIVIKNVSN